jgi:hypothetical protein
MRRKENQLMPQTQVILPFLPKQYVSNVKMDLAVNQ